MEERAEFYEGCMAGCHIIDTSREEWRAVKRPDPLNLSDRAEVHVYKRSVRRFGEFVPPEVRAQIIKERGAYAYVLERVEPLVPEFPPAAPEQEKESK